MVDTSLSKDEDQPEREQHDPVAERERRSASVPLDITALAYSRRGLGSTIDVTNRLTNPVVLTFACIDDDALDN